MNIVVITTFLSQVVRQQKEGLTIEANSALLKMEKSVNHGLNRK